MADDKKNIIVIVLLVIAILGIGYFFWNSSFKSVNEHKTPADISKNEKGTGLDLKLYDPSGKEIEIPDWFSTASIVEPPFTIVRHPPAPTCTVRTTCEGYATNPNIMCWAGACALGNVGSLTMGIKVTNPESSQISFLNLAPTTALPAEFNSALDKTSWPKLAIGDIHTWSSTLISVASWTGSKVFTATVQGTNEYTGAVNTVSDSLTLDFAADPTGVLTASIISPI